MEQTPSSVHEKLGFPFFFPLFSLLEILSTFVGPSVCLFVEKLAPMSSDFNKHGEEAQTDPLV